MVVGRLDRYFPEITVRISNGGRFLEIAPEQVLETAPVALSPGMADTDLHGCRGRFWGGRMNFSKKRPVKIVMLGAAGPEPTLRRTFTGSYMRWSVR